MISAITMWLSITWMELSLSQSFIVAKMEYNWFYTFQVGNDFISHECECIFRARKVVINSIFRGIVLFRVKIAMSKPCISNKPFKIDSFIGFNLIWFAFNHPTAYRIQQGGRWAANYSRPKTTTECMYDSSNVCQKKCRQTHRWINFIGSAKKNLHENQKNENKNDTKRKANAELK